MSIAKIEQVELDTNVDISGNLRALDIVYHVMGMPFNGHTVLGKSLGGSESAAFYKARALAALGHRVRVFGTCTEEGEWDGVTYVHMGTPSSQTPLGDRFHHYATHTPHDVLIVQRHPMAFHFQFASRINIWELHDLALHRSFHTANHAMWQVDAVTAVSEWHKKQIEEVYGFDTNFVRVVRNGVDPKLYDESAHDALQGSSYLPASLRQTLEEIEARRGQRCDFLLYQARPERGLEFLLQDGGIMDQLADTEAHLLVCGYDNTVPQMRPYYDKLLALAQLRGNVSMIGALAKPELAKVQKLCRLMVYPTEFEEVSCISVMEAMHAALPIVCTPAAALSETCKDSGTVIVPFDGAGKLDTKAFADTVRDLLYDDEAVQKLSDLQKAASVEKTWTRSAASLVDTIREAFDRRTATLSARYRHLVEHSDIAALLNELYEHNGSAIDSATIFEARALYDFTSSEKKTKDHYETHQSKYYDEFEARAIGEDVKSTPRYRGVLSFIGQAHYSAASQTLKKLRILDYGCAHGHYLVPLAKQFPESEFVGMDISRRAIEAAEKWAWERENLTNVELQIGSQSDLVLDNFTERFDLIFAGEVLEHVMDWRSLMQAFARLLKPGGIIVATTPLGRWEWSGTEAFREAREHLHHFERDDIRDICGRNPHEIICAPATFDRTGKPMGSWVWKVEPREEFGEINYERKMRRLCPRQTVSACLIVKDAERTIRKCVESFVDYVDEVVIAIDSDTKDRTRSIVDLLCTDYPLRAFRIFDIPPVLTAGFDESRNATVKAAEGEWILWCDADEEIQQPWNMWKYLRSSQVDAIGFPQVHYSTNPPQVLTTDYPTRLFRNNGKIRFYGVVHEHPEIAPGKSIPRALMKPDVQFLHSGYVDEETRRRRFLRNLPLLHRDMQKYPDRGLNRYLWLRDIAQQLMFEQEQTAGYVTDGQQERAMEGIKLFETMIEKDPVRLLADCLKYYSHCVKVTGRGFDVELSFGCRTEIAPDLAAKFDISGRFYSKYQFSKFLNRLNEEATKHYEDKHL